MLEQEIQQEQEDPLRLPSHVKSSPFKKKWRSKELVMIFGAFLVSIYGLERSSTSISGEAFPAFAQQSSGEKPDRLEKITRFLDYYNGGRYYVYDHVNLTLPHIRAKAKDPKSRPSSWGRMRWTQRFKPYAQGELRFYEALEQYQDSRLRTYNISEADFVLVPIPLGAAVFWGEKSDITNAFHHLFHNEPYFAKHPEKHIYITNNERLLRSDKVSLKHFASCCGFSPDVIAHISKGILVKDFDAQSFMQYLLDNEPPGNDWTILFPLFRRNWSLGYSHEVSRPEYNLTIPSYEQWKNKKIVFFYRNKLSMSMFNSTQYRHAIFRNNFTELERLLQPSAVGLNVDYDQWLNEISDSKFCIVVRGDNPSSRSFFTSIRLGCLPVVVSDALPYYQPLFSSLIGYDNFTILINERDFLSNPAESLNKAVLSLSDEKMKRKIDGLALVQQTLALDHPSSLFVPAFVHETMTRLKVPLDIQYESL